MKAEDELSPLESESVQHHYPDGFFKKRFVLRGEGIWSSTQAREVGGVAWSGRQADGHRWAESVQTHEEDGMSGEGVVEQKQRILECQLFPVFLPWEGKSATEKSLLPCLGNQ